LRGEKEEITWGVGFASFRTKGGFELRAVGLQPSAAQYGGVDVPSVWWRAMAASGALAGIRRLNFVLGYKHYYEDGFASGAGFLGLRSRSSAGTIPSGWLWRVALRDALPRWVGGERAGTETDDRRAAGRGHHRRGDIGA